LTKGTAIASVAAAMSLMSANAKPARADGGDVCPAANASWLRVVFAGDGFPPPLRARVLEQLGADLRRHDLALCDAAVADPEHGASAPLAEIGLALSPDASLSIEVRDAVTDKSMSRRLDLGRTPRDALALSITLAAEELLHASWIEAALAPPRGGDAGTTAPATPATGAKPVPAGMFQSQPDGTAMHVQPGPVDVNGVTIAVTLEDQAGAAQPTSAILIVAQPQ